MSASVTIFRLGRSLGMARARRPRSKTKIPARNLDRPKPGRALEPRVLVMVERSHLQHDGEAVTEWRWLDLAEAEA